MSFLLPDHEMKTFVNQFANATGTEKRNTIEKLVKGITLRKDQKLDIDFYSEVAARWRKSTDRYENGRSYRD